jgi:hypothetical protein
LRALVLTPEYLVVAFVLALAGWAWLIQWLGTARAIKSMNLAVTQFASTDANQQAQPLLFLQRFSFTGVASLTGTLLRGGYDNLRNRIGLQLFVYFAFPLLLFLIEHLNSFIKNKPLSGSAEDPLFLLAMGLYGSFVTGFIGREWPARARLLWLRAAGNRAQLWPSIDRLAREDIFSNTIVSLIYAGGLWLLTELKVEYLLWFVLVSLICAAFYTYLTLYLRLRHANIGLNVLFSLLGIIAIAAAIIGAAQQERMWPLAVLVAAFASLSWWLRRQAQRHFLIVDWCRLRPSVLLRPRSGLANSC